MGIQVFNHAAFGLLRTMTTDDKRTMFNLADVCRALEIKNASDAKKRLSKRGVVTTDTPTKNQHGAVVIQQMTYIDEANLYRCIFQSRKVEAEKFQDWVFEEVLPQIRRTGGYIPTRDAQGEQLTESEMMERANRIMARTIARANLPADDCLTASEVARCLDIEVTDLNHFLVRKGIQFWNGSRYRLTARYADCGYAEERIFHYHALDGARKQRMYMVWTLAGKDFIKSIFNK